MTWEALVSAPTFLCRSTSCINALPADRAVVDMRLSDLIAFAEELGWHNGYCPTCALFRALPELSHTDTNATSDTKRTDP